MGEGENQFAHYGPHGGVVNTRDPQHPVILICMSDTLEIKVLREILRAVFGRIDSRPQKNRIRVR